MKIPMKRDMDLIRDILLEIEEGRRIFEIRSASESAVLGLDDEGSMSREEAERWHYNLSLMHDAGLVDFRRSGGGAWFVEGITWAGHDFLDSVRDPEIWEKTKEGAEKAGGFTLDVLGALAKGLIKQKIKQHTGVELEF